MGFITKNFGYSMEEDEFILHRRVAVKDISSISWCENNYDLFYSVSWPNNQNNTLCSECLSSFSKKERATIIHEFITYKLKQ